MYENLYGIEVRKWKGIKAHPMRNSHTLIRPLLIFFSDAVLSSLFPTLLVLTCSFYFCPIQSATVAWVWIWDGHRFSFGRIVKIRLENNKECRQPRSQGPQVNGPWVRGWECWHFFEHQYMYNDIVILFLHRDWYSCFASVLSAEFEKFGNLATHVCK